MIQRQICDLVHLEYAAKSAWLAFGALVAEVVLILMSSQRPNDRWEKGQMPLRDCDGFYGSPAVE